MPLIFFMDGNEKRLRWKTKIFGNLLNSVFILAFDDLLHLSHLYKSEDSRVSSFKKFAMHLSNVDSKARLKVIKGLYVIDFLVHFTHVTIVFYIPIIRKDRILILTTKKLIYDRRVRLVKSIP